MEAVNFVVSLVPDWQVCLEAVGVIYAGLLGVLMLGLR